MLTKFISDGVQVNKSCAKEDHVLCLAQRMVSEDAILLSQLYRAGFSVPRELVSGRDFVISKAEYVLHI